MEYDTNNIVRDHLFPKSIVLKFCKQKLNYNTSIIKNKSDYIYKWEILPHYFLEKLFL